MTTENEGQTQVVIPAGTEKNLFGSTQAFQKKDESGQTVAAPEGTKSGETTQTKDAGASAGTSFADLAAKKGFKDADALAEAYANLEKSHTHKSMELSELARAREEGQREQTTAHSGQNNAGQGKEYTPDEAVAIVEKLIDSKVAPIREQLAIRETFKNAEDMQYAPAVAELVRKNPQIPWDVALKSVKFDSIAPRVQQAEAQVKSHNDALKEKAQAGSQGGRVQKESNLAGMIGDKNVPFSEVQKAMKEAFSQ